MIDPNVGGSKNGDGITITPCSQSIMVGGVPNHATILRYDVLDANSVDNNVVHELNGEASAVPKHHVGAATVDGLVGGNHQLLIQFDHHAALEDDPQGAPLGHGVTDGSWLRVHHVVIGIIGDDIDGATETTGGPSSEPFAALG